MGGVLRGLVTSSRHYTVNDVRERNYVVGGWTDLVLPNVPGGALVSLIGLAIVAVWRGWLVPKITVDTLAAATARVEAVQAERLNDAQERQRELWAAWNAERARGDLQARQIDELLELARTTDVALRALKTTAGGIT